MNTTEYSSPAMANYNGSGAEPRSATAIAIVLVLAIVVTYGLWVSPPPGYPPPGNMA